MDSGSQFSPVLSDIWAPSQDLRKILLVSGKVYYDLVKEIEAASLQNQIRLIRIEELCPFPFALLASTLRDIAEASSASGSDIEVAWVQEEARNQGAYGYVAHRIPAVFDALGWSGSKLSFVGRRQMEVPAVGAASLHARDKKRFMEEALAMQ